MEDSDKTLEPEPQEYLETEKVEADENKNRKLSSKIIVSESSSIINETTKESVKSKDEITPRPGSKSKELTEVVIVMKHKGQVESKKFDLEFTARDIEEAFKLVKCHLEGNDHSVRFPDKETGKYERIDPKVEYTVFGHPYNPDAIWRPKTKLNKKILDIQKGVVLKSGNLLKKQKTFLGGKWVAVYCKLQYCEMELYKASTVTFLLYFSKIKAQKRLKTYDLSTAKVISEVHSDQKYCFQVFTDTKSWSFAASSQSEKEDWIEYIRETAESFVAEEKALSRSASAVSSKNGRERGSTTEEASDIVEGTNKDVSSFNK